MHVWLGGYIPSTITFGCYATVNMCYYLSGWTVKEGDYWAEKAMVFLRDSPQLEASLNEYLLQKKFSVIIHQQVRGNVMSPLERNKVQGSATVSVQSFTRLSTPLLQILNTPLELTAWYRLYQVQWVVTTIRTVLRPSTDPVTLRIPIKVGVPLRILDIDQKINDFSRLNQAIKLDFQWRSIDQGSLQ